MAYYIFNTCQQIDNFYVRVTYIDYVFFIYYQYPYPDE